MCSFKMQEVEKVFDTIVNSFYRSKLLSVIPDVVFTLESTRIHKATIISQNYIKNKHRMNLKKGLDSFRRTVSLYYIKQDKLTEKQKNKDRSCNLLDRFLQRQEKKTVLHYYNHWSKMNSLFNQIDKDHFYTSENDKKLDAIDKLNAQISQKDMVIIKAQKCYQEISKFASTENGQIDEDHYQQTLLKILKTFFIDQHFDLRFDEVCENDFNEEEALDFKWVKHHENCILNLNKPAPKTHQYRMYFRDLDISRSSEYKDIVHVVRLVVNILAWIKTLKGLNSMVMNNEVIPLRQDCKTLTIVNNVRSILEDVSNNEASVENIDRFCFNPRELQAFLQNVCHRVFLALHIETECTIMLDQDSVENSNETEVPEINKKLGADGKYKVPFGEHKNAQTYTTESNDIDIASTHEMIVIKCENIIVEAKVISTCTMAEDMKEFCQTFNPTEQSKLDDYDEDIPINETTKKFIFRLLKNFIETFYSKVFAQKEILIKEDDMSNKLSEYENELRILKDWNQFILLNMNRHNVMDNFEN